MHEQEFGLCTGMRASGSREPAALTDELADVEVTNNAKIDKLRRRRLIEVKPVVEEAPGTSPGDEPKSEAAATPRGLPRSRARIFSRLRGWMLASSISPS